MNAPCGGPLVCPAWSTTLTLGFREARRIGDLQQGAPRISCDIVGVARIRGVAWRASCIRKRVRGWNRCLVRTIGIGHTAVAMWSLQGRAARRYCRWGVRTASEGDRQRRQKGRDEWHRFDVEACALSPLESSPADAVHAERLRPPPSRSDLSYE
jgi:hypothetical protein